MMTETELTPKQKMRIMTAYGHYLKARTALGYPPTKDEITLLSEGMESIQADIQDAMETVIPALKRLVEAMKT